jgi:hypothetical protein
LLAYHEKNFIIACIPLFRKLLEIREETMEMFGFPGEEGVGFWMSEFGRKILGREKV